MANAEPLANMKKLPFAMPITGGIERIPIGGEGQIDCDEPYIIRDASGCELVRIDEDYGPGMRAIHELIGVAFVESVNCRTAIDGVLAENARLRRQLDEVGEALKPIRNEIEEANHLCGNDQHETKQILYGVSAILAKLAEVQDDAKP